MTSISSGFQYWTLDFLSVKLGFWILVVSAISDFLFLELYSGFQIPGFLIPGFLICKKRVIGLRVLLSVVVIVVLQNSGVL